MKNKPSLHDIIVSTLGSIISATIIWLFGGLISILYQIYNGADIRLHNLFTISVPLWSVLLFLSILAIGLIIFRMRRKPLPFLKEHEMTVGNLKRTWRWKYDSQSKQYVIYNLQSYCPQCGKILTCELYARPAYQCINGHGLADVNYSKALNSIVETLRSQYPQYRDIISYSDR